MESVIQLISNVGFPIAACIFMWKLSTDSIKSMEIALNEMKRSIDKLTVQIDRISKK